MTQQAVNRLQVEPDFIKELARITAKEPVALTKPEVEFLHARQSYLTKDEKATFAAVLTALDNKRALKAKRLAQIKASQGKGHT